MTQTVTCPLCDEYTGEKESVATHMFVKGDETHTGVNYQKAVTLIETNTDAEPVEEDEPDEDPSDNQYDTDETTPVGKDPVMGDGNTGNVGTSDDIELPCGHESFNPDNAPEPPFPVECEVCGETWTITDL